jgi:hypothetical protein
VQHSIFAMELCLPLDTALQAKLRRLIIEHPTLAGYHDKWALYRAATESMLGSLAHVEKGCWDYFDDNARALRDYDMWVGGMTTEEGARTSPSGQSDPYRDSHRYMTLTMAFLIVQGSPTDVSISGLCNIPEGYLWKRETFGRILRGMGAISFASVKSDVIYVIPGDDNWGLTAEDLMASKFEYLRPVT